MCQPGEYLVFCTCEKDNPLNTTEPGVKWVLFRHVENILPVEEEQSRMIMIGMAMQSCDSIGDFLTKEMILDSLNNTYAFDFKYDPKAGDILNLIEKDATYFSNMFFVFDGKSWITTNTFLDSYIALTDGGLQCMSVSNESRVLKQSWTHQEISKKAAKFLKEKAFEEAPRLSWATFFKLLGFKKYPFK